jgi:hypothetical protein
LATLRAYERFHVQTLGWLAPGYNFAITGDGTIYECRGWWTAGGHTSGRNRISHAVVLVGDFTTRTVPEPMVDALVWLTREGHRVGALRAPVISGGHREAPNQSTQCPGAGGLAAVRRARLKLTQTTPPAPPVEEVDTMFAGLKQGDRSPRVEELQRVLNAVSPREERITVDGQYGPATRALVVRRTGVEDRDNVTSWMSVELWLRLIDARVAGRFVPRGADVTMSGRLG